MRNRYSVDKNNQLTVRKPGEKKPLFIRGRFSADKKNRLIYLVNQPVAWRRKFGLAKVIRFEGSWNLSQAHQLEFKLDNSKESYPDILALRGRMLDVSGDEFAFEIVSRQPERNIISLVRLTGKWQANQDNQLTFAVRRQLVDNILVLSLSWQVNKKQQICYEYEIKGVSGARRALRTLLFSGFWEINNSNRITYILSSGSNSSFEFRCQLESPNLRPADRIIKYRIGIGLRRLLRPKQELLCFYGAWKFSRKLGLSFEMDYGQNRLRSQHFGFELSLDRQNELALELKNSQGQPVGINLKLTHHFLKQADASFFLRFKQLLQHAPGIEAGLEIPF